MGKVTIILLFVFASLFFATPVFADPPPLAGGDVTAFYEAGDRVVFPPAEINYGPAHVWTGPDGTPLPFETVDEIEAFLLTASPTSVETIRTGVNLALISKDRLYLKSVFLEKHFFGSINAGTNRFHGRW